MLRTTVLVISLLAFACATPTAVAPPMIDPAAYEKAAPVRSFLFSYLGKTVGEKPLSDTGEQMAGMVGREDLIVAKKGETLGLKACPPLPGDPVAEIARRARETNIVIINEAHTSPRDRQFIGKVLLALRPLGYTTYAAETLNNNYPIDHPPLLINDGFYSSEPIFGRMIMEAKRLGYRLVSYEMTEAQGMAEENSLPLQDRLNRRDAAQTANLVAAIFKDHPDEKVIIHVGYGHVQERGNNAGANMMAQRLAKATGRDPLTISQTSCLSGSGVTAIVQGSTTDVDIEVGHPPLKMMDGRPEWRQAMGDIKTPIPPGLLPTTEPLLIEARPLDAPVDTVAIDRVLLRPGEALPLLLPPGRYRLDVTTASGDVARAPTVVSVRK